MGEEASPELAALAEDGLTDPLTMLIDDMYPKFHYAVAGDAVMPGKSVLVKLEISKRGGLSWISVAGMLVTTNDAFFAAHNIWFFGKEKVTAYAVAYDAGSEWNSEDCAFIPGPPCGNPGVHDDAADPEGYVHIHAGIHGVGPNPRVNPAMHDWRNPVAKITIRRIYN